MLSSLQNWANHNRYQLWPSTPAQLCWSSSRLQPLRKYKIIKFAWIRPSTLNQDRNLWNCRGVPEETTCFTVFFQCPSALTLFLHEIVQCLCQETLSLSLSKINKSRNKLQQLKLENVVPKWLNPLYKTFWMTPITQAVKTENMSFSNNWTLKLADRC